MSQSLFAIVFSPRNIANFAVRYALLPLETYAVFAQLDSPNPKKSFVNVALDTYVDPTLITMVVIQHLLNNILTYINSRKANLIGQEPSKALNITWGVVITLYSIITFYPVKNYLRWNQVDVATACTPTANGCIPHERLFPVSAFFSFPLTDLFRGLFSILFLYALMDAVKGGLSYAVLPTKLKAKVNNKTPLTSFDKFLIDYAIPMTLSTIFYPVDAIQKRLRVYGFTTNHRLAGFLNDGLPYLLAEMALSKFASNVLNKIQFFRE